MFSSIDTLQRTFVFPIEIKTEPSAYEEKSVFITTGLSSSGLRLSARIPIPKKYRSK
jgi:hypothetical protein